MGAIAVLLLIAAVTATLPLENPCMTAVCDDTTCVTKPLCEQVFFLVFF